jgi:hypothetical protein
MVPEKVEETCKKVMSWLSEEALYKDKVYDENLYFHLAAEFPARSGRHVNVIQPNNRDDMIVVLSTIRLAEVHQKALQALARKDREKFIWDMRYALLFQDSNFDMEPGGGELNGIRFSREIYYDGLTKNKLMEVLRANFKCELYVVWKFQEAFGAEPAATGHVEQMYG